MENVKKLRTYILVLALSLMWCGLLINKYYHENQVKDKEIKVLINKIDSLTKISIIK